MSNEGNAIVFVDAFNSHSWPCIHTNFSYCTFHSVALCLKNVSTLPDSLQGTNLHEWLKLKVFTKYNLKTLKGTDL